MGVLVYLSVQKHLELNQVLALSLVSGGSVGNLADRTFNQCRVVVFMNVGIGSLLTGIFNLADIAILCGALWFLLISVHPAGKGNPVQ